MTDRKLIVFIDLDAEECRTDQDSREQEERAPRLLAPLDGRQGENHGHRGTDQDERVGGREVDGQRIGQLVVGRRPFVRLEGLDFHHRPRGRELGGQAFGLRLGQTADEAMRGFFDRLLGGLLTQANR